MRGGGGPGLDTPPPPREDGDAHKEGWRGEKIISFLSSGPFPFANLAFVRRPSSEVNRVLHINGGLHPDGPQPPPLESPEHLEITPEFQI